MPYISKKSVQAIGHIALDALYFKKKMNIWQFAGALFLFFHSFAPENCDFTIVSSFRKSYGEV